MTDKALHSGPFGRLDPSLPQVFGRYLLVQRLSRGGMGEIFLAKHGLAGFEKLAVIKKVLPHLAADAQFISRFVDEAQVAIKLQHVNVAQVFEVGRVGDEYFLALEYIEGRDLRRTLALLGHRRQRLPVDLALFVSRELANGLAYAHRRTSADGASLHLVHCDISPPNVLVSFEGETKVIDFGIAKSALRGTATDPKLGFGKFGYMAPEQLIRGGIVDARTDIYAAGVVLFELLTTHRLYEAGPDPDYRALAKKVAHGEHPLPSDVDPMLAPYDDLVAIALRPKAEDRYQTAAEFRDAIQQALVAVNPTISTDQLGSFMRELFTEEMTAQRELHERVANAHLADFQEQFHTQTISTVSFALAQLPLPPPPPEPALPPRAPARGTQLPPPPRSSPALDTLSLPTGALHGLEDELALADGTGHSLRQTSPSAPRRRRGLYAIAGVSAAAIGALVAFAIVSGGRPSTAAGARDAGAGSAPRSGSSGAGAAPGPGSSAPPAEPTKQEITVIPIDQPDASPPPPPEQGSAQDIEMSPIQVGSGSARPKPVRITRPPDRNVTADGRRDPRKEPDKKPGLTRDAVAGKFSSARREYNAFKDRNGDRLDGEWNDLASFITYQLRSDNLEDAMRRIEAFRAKLRE
ncbi:MAG TPA: serine/threonine-protein kinase [Kofleriaceae bacterium]|nr:serine/threonine-protein kinase [Kofleriaceae bacterium]